MTYSQKPEPTIPMFRFKLIPTLFTLPTLIVLISLGCWQTKRLYWKEAIIGDIIAKSEEPALALREHAALTDALRYRKVSLTGEFLNDKEVHLFTGEIQFKGETGYHILTPFKRADDGEIILVNRGWVPASYKNPDTRRDTEITGQHAIEALVLEGDTKPMPWLPDNDRRDNVWFWQDIPEIAQYTGLELAPFILLELHEGARISVGQNGMNWAELRTPEPPFPMPSDGHISIRNDHLQYAITWYSLAVILLVIYLVYHRKR
jgi:surfeit locus 1 family protein